MDELIDNLEELLQRSIAEARERNRRTPELMNKEWFHVHDIFIAFVNGVVRADSWYRGYSCPPNLSEVFDYIAKCVESEYGKEIVVNVSVNEVVDKLKSWAMDNLSFRSWNTPASGDGNAIRIASRYSDLARSRDFIDLDAVFQNVTVYLRDLIRINKEFNAKYSTLTKPEIPDDEE